LRTTVDEEIDGPAFAIASLDERITADAAGVCGQVTVDSQ
jgi:hypothetical protein